MYVLDLLDRVKMLEAKPVSTPLEPHTHLTLHASDSLTNPTKYRTLVGSLQCLGLTCPNVAFAVNRLSRFMHKPTSHHWQTLKRALRYLKGTLDYGLTLYRDSPLQLHAFPDADWAGDRDDFISTRAYIVYLGPNPIS